MSNTPTKSFARKVGEGAGEAIVVGTLLKITEHVINSGKDAFVRAGVSYQNQIKEAAGYNLGQMTANSLAQTTALERHTRALEENNELMRNGAQASGPSAGERRGMGPHAGQAPQADEAEFVEVRGLGLDDGLYKKPDGPLAEQMRQHNIDVLHRGKIV